MTRQLLLFLCIALFIGLASFLPVEAPSNQGFFTSTVDTSVIFPHSNTCKGCHGFDENGIAFLTSDGLDVNIHDDWSASMMANSARDPFWRAKVSHEILVNPAHSLELQTKCTSCHAPQGHYTAILRGAAHYTIAEMLADTIAMDGVSCGACHAQSTELLGDLHSGELRFDTNRVLYGPYEFPFAAPMIQYVGFEPIFSEHINDAGICAGCHTLLTNTADLEGNLTGQTFVEQATYHEWLNSAYETGNVSCQSCHMPRIDEPIIISSNYLFLEGREPFGLHDMIGANSTMLKLMKEHRDTLGIPATPEAFDETIQKTLAMLQAQSLETYLEFVESRNDTAFFSAWLYNKAGHKFPSGYPSRRAFIEFFAVDAAGDTIFHSGKLDADWEVAGLDPQFEPHFLYINRPDQVQIYETVIGDVTGQFTTVLERAAITLKDNRLPPLGFKTGHAVYDTTQIVGAAASDPDFNWKDGQEGSGADRIFYHIPLNGYVGNLNVGMRVHYQSLPPRWMAPMLAEDTPEINHFRDMFESADKSTVIVAENALEDVYVIGGTAVTQRRLPAHLIRVFPNPAQENRIQVALEPGVRVNGLRLYDSRGRLVFESKNYHQEIVLPGQGLFFLEINTSQGLWSQKIVSL